MERPLRDWGTWGLGDLGTNLLPAPYLPISLSPYLPISLSPYLPISLAPALPIFTNVAYLTTAAKL